MKSPPRKFLFWILWLFELNGTAFLIYCHDDVLSSVTTFILRSNIVLSLLVLARCQCLIGSTLFVNSVNSVRVTTASMLVISLVAIVIEWFFFFLKSNFVFFSLFMLHAFFVLLCLLWHSISDNTQKKKKIARWVSIQGSET